MDFLRSTKLCPSKLGMVWISMWVGSAMLLVDSAWADPVPSGSAFQVNAYTTGRQLRPSVAHIGGDRFAVVWEGETTGDRFIYGRRIDGAGVLGAELFVSSSTTDEQESARVASTGDGAFLVVWEHDTSPRPAVESRRYASDGTPSAVVTVAPTLMDHSAYSPDITVDENRFVVVWEDYYPGANTFELQGRNLDGAGQLQGGVFTVVERVNGTNLSYPGLSDPAGDGFSLSWREGSDLQAQAFDSSGMAVGSTLTASNTGYDVAHTALDDGGYLVVWSESIDGLKRRRYASDGTPSTPVVISATSQVQRDADVVALPDGRAAVTWRQSSSGQPPQIMMQIVAADDGAESTLTVDEASGSAAHPRLAYDAASDELAVVWHRVGPDGDREEVYFRKYALGAIFADGFESGDTTAWSP